MVCGVGKARMAALKLNIKIGVPQNSHNDVYSVSIYSVVKMFRRCAEFDYYGI